MNILRNAASWTSLYLVAGLFFLTANAFALFTVINADNFKETLKEEGTYDKIVPAVLSTSSYASDVTEGQQLPLNEPWVKEAAMKAFPASDLEQKSNDVIDATFAWLDGETEKPEYMLDFTSNKQNLALEIGSSTEAHLASLPRCAPGNIPPTIDAFRIDCLPFGVSAKSVADRASSQINNDQGFLKDPVISSENLSEASEGNVADNPFEQLEGIRSFYENRGLLLWLLPVLAVVFTALGLLLAQDRLKALKRLGRAFIASGMGLAVFAILISFGFEKAVKTAAGEAITRDIAGPVLVSLGYQFRTVYLIFAGVAVVIAIVLLVVRRKLLKPGALV